MRPCVVTGKGDEGQFENLKLSFRIRSRLAVNSCFGATSRVYTYAEAWAQTALLESRCRRRRSLEYLRLHFPHCGHTPTIDDTSTALRDLQVTYFLPQHHSTETTICTFNRASQRLARFLHAVTSSGIDASHLLESTALRGTLSKPPGIWNQWQYLHRAKLRFT